MIILYGKKGEANMEFTQEKRTNLDICDFCTGCDEHCEFGVSVSYKDFREFAYPTIKGKPIKEYLCKNGQVASTGKPVMYKDVLNGKSVFRQEIIDQARKIATLCDNYKTR